MKFEKEELVLTGEWDKTFALSAKVNHRKVTFKNHFGLTLAADMYEPKNYEGKLPAIAVSGPYGAIKEQCSGLYAMKMAERGFLTIAFDPSFTGESSGFPRYMSSPDVNTEDFMASVDYLRSLEIVDKEKIGIIGICGWGGIALNTAAIDPRIKATISSTMYDMTRVSANGYFDENDNEDARHELRVTIANQRDEDYKTGEYKLAGGCLELPVPEDSPFFVKDYSEYYKGRCYHKRSLNSNGGWAIQNNTSWLNAKFLQYTNEIRSAVMIVHGDKAHSYYFGETAFKNMMKDNKYTDNKKFLSIPGAVHTDLYDNLEVIPFDEFESFFSEYLK